MVNERMKRKERKQKRKRERRGQESGITKKTWEEKGRKTRR